MSYHVLHGITSRLLGPSSQGAYMDLQLLAHTRVIETMPTVLGGIMSRQLIEILKILA